MDAIELRDRVLQFVATARRSVHVSDVARGLKLDPISVASALTALTQIGFVQRVRHGRARCRYWMSAPVRNPDAIPMGWGYASPRKKVPRSVRRAQFELIRQFDDLAAGIQPQDLVAKIGLNPQTARRWCRELRNGARA